ncbi:hypothetical protein BU15DRAFT_62232 [Melanogaster broomeanus]|nr:hypothetical protein BU15DRAFT_62232 [Melanogaster broomeanus]
MSETTNEGPLGIVEETDAILYGPGGRVEPSVPDRTPSTEATNKTGPSSGTCPRHTNDTRTGQRHGTNVHSEGRNVHGRDHRCDCERERDRNCKHTSASERTARGAQGSWESTGHADEEVQTSGGIKAAYKDDATSCQAGTKLNEDDMAAAAQSVSRRSTGNCIHDANSERYTHPRP